MALVNFTLSEDGVSAFNDALVCIHKFSDDVSLEIKKDKLVLTALNLTKSAYVSFTFAANRFFSRFHFEGNAQYRERFFCSIYIKARPLPPLLCGDPTRDRENVTTIERCDVAIDDGPGKKSRFIAKIFCRNGITATHRLSFEAKAPVHAKFDKSEAGNRWTINSRTLRSLMEHFGPGIDLLDINTDGDNVVNFTCFTEKQASVNNEAVLKKPLHTSIAVEMDEFDDIEVADKLHIIISVRDFRAILQHANYTSGDLNAAYSRPGRPMKIFYGRDGITCEFVLMTVDEKSTAVQKKGQGKAATKAARPALNAAPNTPAAGANDDSRQATPAPPREQPEQQARMPPPARRPTAPRSSQFDIRAPLIQPQSTLKSESLFLPQPDDDETWAPINPDDEEDGENPRLEWDASDEPNPSTTRISDHSGNTQSNPPNDSGGPLPPFVEPTQRVSEVRRFGLFTDW
ncbi:Rad9-domain-containing protein [Diaporthe sp. PMI_573]|nr:Rad9-domain-containing protein [Diaporthaceae sp. PMI_573]